MKQSGKLAAKAPTIIQAKSVGRVPGGRIVSVERDGETYVVFVPDGTDQGSGDA